MGSTKTERKKWAFLFAVFVVAISPAPSLCFAQDNWDRVSADSSDIRRIETIHQDEGSNRFDVPFEGTAEDKQRMDEFADQITVCVVFFHRSIVPFLIRLYVIIGFIFMLRSIVKKMATDS